MRLSPRFWVHLLSHLALVAILARLLAGWVGTFRQEAQATHRKVLLIVVALRSWAGLVSAALIGALLRAA